MVHQAPTSIPWYVDAFDELYPLLYPHRDDASADQQIAALRSWLNLPPSQRVLDVACGAGRHLASLRRSGADAWGLDLSVPLLARAAARAECRGRVVRCDMRAIPFGPVFDLVVNLFSSFGYFQHDHDNQRALHEMAGVLRPGGRLVIDHIHADHLTRTLTRDSQSAHGSTTVVHHRTIEDQRVVKRSTITFEDGSTRRVTESVRLYQSRELSQMMKLAGLSDPTTCGDFNGSPLTDDADRMILTATRPR
ncbi:MAG: SAM-dependent methyltransferase [Planctomycetaceae bacterium]|nr:SAM-dependent methyltransferase [Planctomycetaceae bacterium]